MQPTGEIEYIQNNLLVDDDRYEYFLRVATKHYQKLCNTHKFEYRPYQPEMAAAYALRASNVCAGSCGLGKTCIIGLLICCLFTELTQVGQVQIAAPNKISAKTRWLDDLQQIDHLKDQIDLIYTETQALESTKPIWIYTTDFIKRKSKTIKDHSRNTMDRLLAKRGRRPSLLVVDEAHLLKPKSLRSKHWYWWRQRAKRFIAMSGTLSDGRLDILGHVLKLTYGRIFPYVHLQDFLDDYNANTKVKSNYLKGEIAVQTTAPRYLSHIDLSTLPAYSKLARTFINRVSLNDANVKDVITLPTFSEKVIKVVPTIEHKNYYNVVIKTIKDELSSMQAANWTIALNLISPLIEASNNPPEYRVKKNQKLNKLLSLVDNCEGKTAVFCCRVDSARKVHQALQEKYNINAIRLYANDKECRPKTLNAQRREDLVCRFLYDPDVRVGTFSINLAAESIDLNVAEQVIFYDFPWQPVKIQQAKYRVIRPGSPVDHVNIIYLYNQGMIDQHQYTLLKERDKSSTALLDFDPTAMTQSSLAVIDTSELIKRTISTGLQLDLSEIPDEIDLDDDVPF